MLEVRTSPTAVTNYYVQCPILPGKTINDPWTPPPFNYPSFYSCQVLGERMLRHPNADVIARYTSYAESWRSAIETQLSPTPGERETGLQVVKNRWNVTGDALTTLIGQEIERCGGASPGFMPATFPVRPLPPGARK